MCSFNSEIIYMLLFIVLLDIQTYLIGIKLKDAYNMNEFSADFLQTVDLYSKDLKHWMSISSCSQY
jgi:hypothetical protein